MLDEPVVIASVGIADDIIEDHQRLKLKLFREKDSKHIPATPCGPLHSLYSDPNVVKLDWHPEELATWGIIAT